MRQIQVRPGTSSLFTDQADFLGTIADQDYLEEIVVRFNGYPKLALEIGDLEEEIASLKRELAGRQERIADLEEEINDREVDDEI